MDQQIEEVLEKDVYAKRDRITPAVQKLCGEARKKLDKFMKKTNLYESLKHAGNFLVAHPVLFAACIVALAAVIVPLILFIIFAVTTIAFTFTGFIIVQGILLVVGTTVLCGVLFSIITTMTMMGLGLILTYHIVSYMLLTVKNVKMAMV